MPALVRTSRREPVAVPEARRPDRTLVQMKAIRQQRLQRLEADAVAAREACAAAARTVRAANAATKALDARTRTFWAEAMQAFLERQIDSRELQNARAGYKRLCAQAAAQRVQARSAVQAWRDSRAQRREAQARCRQAQKAVEKLSMWQDMQREQELAAES